MRVLRNRRKSSESGATLYLVAAVLVALMGISALAIDLVSFFVVRSEAQRAADAGALAGAKYFVSSLCTSASGTGSCDTPEVRNAATAQAIQVASQNLVGGQAPSSSNVDVAFNFSSPGGGLEPQIIVTVSRDATHSNAVPTFFAKVFGYSSVDVSASAKAEAFNPSGSGEGVGASCVRPFLVPNCDPSHLVTSSTDSKANTNCPMVSGKYQSYFFYPSSNPNDSSASRIVNPGVYPGGILGQSWTLHTDAAPSQWWLLQLAGTPSGSDIRNFIKQCAPQASACSSPLNTATGFKVGPTDQGINDLINASGDGLGNGQDSICTPAINPSCSSLPFTMTGGSNNQSYALRNQTFTDYAYSTSVATVAVYDGHALISGNQNTVTVVGYMQLFIRDANHSGTDDVIDTVVLNISACGGSASVTPPVIGPAGSPIPIRLIR